MTEIDTSAILPRSSRRAAAAKHVDYSSPEALAKAGLTKKDLESDVEDEPMET
jgi:hypothetical protein